jgi:hypothetical protein
MYNFPIYFTYILSKIFYITFFIFTKVDSSNIKDKHFINIHTNKICLMSIHDMFLFE